MGGGIDLAAFALDILLLILYYYIMSEETKTNDERCFKPIEIEQLYEQNKD